MRKSCPQSLQRARVKPKLKDSAFQECRQITLHIDRNRLGVRVFFPLPGEPGLEMLLHGLVDHRAFGLATLVVAGSWIGRNRQEASVSGDGGVVPRSAVQAGWRKQVARDGL